MRLVKGGFFGTITRCQHYTARAYRTSTLHGITIDGDARVRPVSNPGNILWDGAVVYVVYICDPLYCMNINRFQIEDIEEDRSRHSNKM